MKLATIDDGTRDGALALVSSDLRRSAPAGAVAGTLQQALDDWRRCGPLLRDLWTRLEDGRIEHAAFDPARCLAPLPRAYAWIEGAAYVNHLELVRRARGAAMPASFWTDPLMYQGGSDALSGPCAPILVPAEAFAGEGDYGIDFEAAVAIVTDDVPMGVSAQAALDHVRLVLLANDVSLRGLVPAELAKGFGFLHAKPSTSFSPVAMTPDALGDAWRDGRLHLRIVSHLNGRTFGRLDAGADMTFDFGRLISHAARTRRLAAGTILGSGPVSNKAPDGGPGRPVAQGGDGYSCIAECRMVETIETGAARTPYRTIGDTVRIEAFYADGRSVFGAIEQAVKSA